VSFPLLSFSQRSKLISADGYLNAEQLDKVSEQVDALCLEIRQYAVPLIDAFALSDHLINSPLGKWDGSVYESYFAQVRASNPLPKEHPYFERLIRPLLERKNAELPDVEKDMGLDEELEEMRQEAAKAAKGGKPKKVGASAQVNQPE
jgi:acyl-CoA oxidase